MKSYNLLILAAALTLTGTAVAGDSQAGREKSSTCVACHGEWGISASGQFPNLAGQHADYLAQSLKAYRSGKRTNPIMAGFAAGLSDEDIADLAAFYAAQKGLKAIP